MTYPLNNKNVSGFPLIHYSTPINSDYGIRIAENKSVLSKIRACLMPLSAYSSADSGVIYIGMPRSALKLDQISQTLNALIQGIALIAVAVLLPPSAVGTLAAFTGGMMVGYNGVMTFRLGIDGTELRQIIDRNLNYYLPLKA